jgi:hypothetical protein
MWLALSVYLKMRFASPRVQLVMHLKIKTAAAQPGQSLITDDGWGQDKIYVTLEEWLKRGGML